MSVFTADPSDPNIQAVASPTSPSHPSSVSTFARFEFEPGRGNDGTKILMIEWEDDDISRSTSGAWHVSWPGNSSQLPADDRPTDNVRRIYLLLGPGQSVPPTVTLSYEPPKSKATAKQPDSIMINPLPAIFPPELGASARQSGKRGVLHTIWAKKRLQFLDREIEREQEFNLEGIALEMATTEKNWIENNFGIVSARSTTSTSRLSGNFLQPTSPRSPGGGRLSEKLRGLSLGTTEKDLGRTMEVNTPSHESHPLSPETQDVAVSFFGSFKTTPSAANPSVAQVAHAPTLASGSVLPQKQAEPTAPFDQISRQISSDSGDDLFAKALNPRTR